MVQQVNDTMKVPTHPCLLLLFFLFFVTTPLCVRLLQTVCYDVL